MKLSRDQAFQKEKHGVNLCVYPVGREEAGVVYIEVDEGHFEEFYRKVSTFIYYIIEGEGTFYLNGEAVTVKAADCIVITPMTTIYYLGKMKMTLTTVPAWNEENEVHVRYIEKNEI